MGKYSQQAENKALRCLIIVQSVICRTRGQAWGLTVWESFRVAGGFPAREAAL